MSKADKPVKQTTASQLKKDLNQASKVLQNLTNSLERLETSLSDAEAALSTERSLKEALSLAQKRIRELQEAQDKAQKDQQIDISKFADVAQKLTKEYEDRSTKLQLKHESELKEFQRQSEVMEAKWKQTVDHEKAEIRRLKEVESQCRNESEDQLRKTEDIWQKKEQQLHHNLQLSELQIRELLSEKDRLMKEASDNDTVRRGRDVEIQKLGSKLGALEAFSQQDAPDKVAAVIVKLQESLREFCIWCVDSAETLPGWNQFPEGLRYKHLPRVYYSDSSSGRYVLIAAIQHSVCAAMARNFPPRLAPYTDQGFWDVSEALFRINHSHEAIWRLMTVNTILRDKEMTSRYKTNLRETAKSLLSSWKPFPGDGRKQETLERLAQLLIDSATTFLDLMKVRKRIQVSVDVVNQYFDSDSEEESHTVPGGFELPDSTATVLCLFPAFFWNGSPAAASQLSLLRKGKAMFRDSPSLLTALNDEQEVRSPNIGSKRRPTT